MSAESGYEADGDARWAFGTGFTDPLHGVDAAVPPGTDRVALAARCVALGDDALIGAQRLAQWCTRAPELELELALANVGLDLLGQARLLYSRAGQVDGSGRDEDAWAYLRGPARFTHVRLAELPNGDFAFTVARLLALSAWRLAVFRRLAGAADPVLAAIAAKGAKELAYHREFAADWLIRLGDGTSLSHRRMRAALDALTPWLAELLDDPAETGPAERAETVGVLESVTAAAGLPLSVPPLAPHRPGGRAGHHTPHLAPLLAELQSVARAHPGAAW